MTPTAEPQDDLKSAMLLLMDIALSDLDEGEKQERTRKLLAYLRANQGGDESSPSSVGGGISPGDDAPVEASLTIHLGGGYELAEPSSPWKEYIGKRGPRKGQQVGWRNTVTGRIVYQQNRPGSGRGSTHTTATGKTVRRAAPKEQQADPHETAQHVMRLIANPRSITADQVREVTEKIFSMTVAKMNEFKKHLREQGFRASGPRPTLSKKLVARAEAVLQEAKDKAPAPKAEKPKTRGKGPGREQLAEDNRAFDRLMATAKAPPLPGAKASLDEQRRQATERAKAVLQGARQPVVPAARAKSAQAQAKADAVVTGAGKDEVADALNAGLTGKKPLTKTEPPRKAAPAPSEHRMVTDAIKRLDPKGNNLVSLHHLRHELSKQGVETRAEQDKVINAARRGKAITLSPFERPASAQEKEAAIQDDTRSPVMGYVSIRHQEV